MIEPMVRPCFLVVDQEYSGNISTRKLVLESAKLNVITAYSGAEALATLERFPAVSGVVLDARIPDIPCEEIVAALKQMQPTLPIIVVGSPRTVPCDADHTLESFDPRRLLALIERLLPKETASIIHHDEKLKLET